MDPSSKMMGDEEVQGAGIAGSPHSPSATLFELKPVIGRSGPAKMSAEINTTASIHSNGPLSNKMNNPRSLFSKLSEMPSMARLAPPAGKARPSSCRQNSNGKETMEKEEIEQLRSQVLRSNRPTNPWFETQKPLNSGNPSLSSSPSPPSEAERTTARKSIGDKMHPSSATASQPPPLVAVKHERAEDNNFEAFAATRRLAEDMQVLRELESESARLLSRARIATTNVETAVGVQRPLDVPTVKSPEPQFTATESVLLSSPSSSSNSSSSNGSSYNSTKAYSRRQLGRSGIADKPLPAVHKPGTEVLGSNDCRFAKAVCEAVCAKCRKPIVGDVILRTFDKTYHPGCFRCVSCFTCLDGVPFTIDANGDVYCMEDYERLFVPACAKCAKPIAPMNKFGQIVRVVLSGGIEYHMECYSCEGCGRQLSNESGSRCYPLEEHLLCRTCHAHWKRAGGVDQPITDL